MHGPIQVGGNQGDNRDMRLHCSFAEIPLQAHAFNPVFLIRMGIAGGKGVEGSSNFWKKLVFRADSLVAGS